MLQELPADLKARADVEGEASLRGQLKAEGAEEPGSQSYVPPDEQDDSGRRSLGSHQLKNLGLGLQDAVSTALAIPISANPIDALRSGRGFLLLDLNRA